jgi:hypothetical protein
MASVNKTGTQKIKPTITMDKNFAEELSHTITNAQIFDMLEKAKVNVKDWTKASVANKGLSRGTHWNIFCKDFKIENKYSPILKYRMIQEYGEFLPTELQPPKKEKRQSKPTHFDPIF